MGALYSKKSASELPAAVAPAGMAAAEILSWPFDQSFPLEVQPALARDFHAELCRHAYFELVFLEVGEIVFEVEGRLVAMRAGDLFVMGSALLHRVRTYVCEDARGIALHFLPELIRAGDMTHEDIEYLTPFLVQNEEFSHVVPAATGVPAQVRDLMERIRSELPARSDRNRVVAKTYLKMILVLLMNYYAATLSSTTFLHRRERDFERLKPLLDFIERHYSERLTLEQAAAILHLSPSHFMRLFRRVTGEPLMSYLNRFRIAKAEALLASTNKTIAQVSQEVGFCDQSYFGYIFRKLVHMTPREYREQRRVNTQ